MSDFISKISSYNLFNYLFPGILFSILVDKFTPYSLIQKDLLLWLFLYYFIGLVISRIGSLIIEPFLKRIWVLKFADHKDFIVASRKDEKIETLLEKNNMYRTLISTFSMFFVLKTYESLTNYFPTLNNWKIYILLIGLLAMFLLSYIKQTKYIKQHILGTLEK